MAVDLDLIEAIVQESVDLYRAAERALLQLVTSKLEQSLDAPEWAVSRQADVGSLRTAAQNIVDQLDSDVPDAITAAVAQAYREGDNAVLTDLPDDPSIQRAARAATTTVPRSAAMESLAAALVRDVGQRHSNVLRRLTDVYQRVVAEATAVSVAGGLPRRQAAQLAYARFVDQGIASFQDRRGRNWRLTSYVEMALRTVTQRAAVQGQTDRQTRMGLPFVVVSNEAQECRLCRPYEGKVLRIDAGPIGEVAATNPATGAPVSVQVKATLDAARAAGFQHPNCRHSVRAYLPGVTPLPEPPTADAGGDAARQRQRGIERAIRRWKEREQAALSPEGKASARARVKLWQSQMQDHLAAHPSLKRLRYREQIGAGNLPRTRTTTPASTPQPVARPERPPLLQRVRVTQPPARVDDLASLLEVDMTAMANRRMVRDVLGDIIGGDYAGISVEITSAERYPYFGHTGDRPGILVQGRLYPDGDLDADAIGEVHRGFYRDEDGYLVAVHALLAIERNYRGRGFATAFNGHLVDWYRQQRISRVEVHANIDVGGYTWATEGFEFADAQSADDVLARLRFMRDDYAERMDTMRRQADVLDEQGGQEDQVQRLRARADKLQAQLDEAATILEAAELHPFGADGFPTSWRISQCGRGTAVDGNMWLGKSAMLGSDWEGVKWL